MTDATPPPPPPPAADWRPPKQPESNFGAIVVGLVFLVIGVWFFLERTLGFQMPDVRLGDLWPILLIVLGGVVLFRAARDRA